MNLKFLVAGVILFLGCHSAPHDCYDSKCVGNEPDNATTIDCPQKDHVCNVDKDTGKPSCDPFGNGGNGINCTITTEQDQSYCSSDDATGKAICVYPPKHSCYDTKCTGTKEFADKVIDCLQEEKRCVIADSGEPSCFNTTRGDGVDCYGVKNSDFYCLNNATTGKAVCVQTPPFDCYDTKCVGKEPKSPTTIDCPQKDHICNVDKDTGKPSCDPFGNGGNGINCTITTEQDQSYCSSDDATGKAICVYPPKHSCYDTKCTGTKEFADKVIDCLQEEKRCVIADSGEPSCVNTTRGDGVDCDGTGHVDYYCGHNSSNGKAKCMLTPAHSCYSLQCQGTGNYSTIFKACNGATKRCKVNTDGSPDCVPDGRGTGVNCNTTLPYYCDYTDDHHTNATCRYSQKYDCFNTKCAGILNDTLTYIECPQEQGHCSVNPADGSPVCVASNSTTGEGTFCSGHFACKQDPATGVASCQKKRNLTPLWVVLGIVAVVLVVLAIMWVVKRRSATEDTRPLL